MRVLIQRSKNSNVVINNKINGSIDLELESDTIRYENTVAYYVHSNNEFLLLLKEI